MSPREGRSIRNGMCDRASVACHNGGSGRRWILYRLLRSQNTDVETVTINYYFDCCCFAFIFSRYELSRHNIVFPYLRHNSGSRGIGTNKSFFHHVIPDTSPTLPSPLLLRLPILKSIEPHLLQVFIIKSPNFY